jgi:hypothetical protein
LRRGVRVNEIIIIIIIIIITVFTLNEIIIIIIIITVFTYSRRRLSPPRGAGWEPVNTLPGCYLQS